VIICFEGFSDRPFRAILPNGPYEVAVALDDPSQWGFSPADVGDDATDSDYRYGATVWLDDANETVFDIGVILMNP
jgi:hypothetical protein